MYTKRIKKQTKVKITNLTNKMLRNIYKENASEKPTNTQLKWKPIQKAVTESLGIKTKAKPQKDLLTGQLPLKLRKKHHIEDSNDQDKAKKLQRERN